MGTVDVSVVMASYNTGARIEWTLSELQRQSLDPSEFEVVVIDDGSTDDTFDRLQRLAGVYPNLVVDRIPGSGWPGRPRNVGVQRASGDYVLFMDHDDAMFPEALERLVAFARDVDADVVIPKEVVDGWKTPGWATWRENVPRVTHWDAEVVACLTPHKLYRREYLLEHDIRFPEGRIRLEDFDFNAQAFVRTEKVAIFAAYPCYTWIIGTGNSHKAGYDVQVYWDSFERSLQPIVRELPPGTKRDTLLARWYRSRILERLNPQLLGFSDSYRGTLAEKFSGLLHYFPPGIDAALTPADRMRSVLLRRGDWEALAGLAELDRGIRPAVSETRVSWEGDRWVLVCRGHVEGASGPVRVARVDGRVHRVVPDHLGLSPEETDLTDALAASRSDLIVHRRPDLVDWNLPTEGGLDVDGDRLTFSLRAELDPATAAFGEPLDDGIWDLVIRILGLGWPLKARLAAPKPVSDVAIGDGRQALLYTTVGGTVAVDTRSEARALLDHARPDRKGLVVTSEEKQVAIRWPLPHVHVPAGARSSLSGEVLVDDHAHPARVIANAAGATLLAFVEVPEDDAVHAVRARFGIRASRPLAGLRRGADGVRIVRAPRPPSEPQSTPEAVHTGRGRAALQATAISARRRTARGLRTARARWARRN